MANDDLSSAHHQPATTANGNQSFWFDDGSIVISVDKEHLKVHKSLVLRHSTLLPSLPILRSDAGESIVEIPEGRTDVKDFTALLEHLYHDV